MPDFRYFTLIHHFSLIFVLLLRASMLFLCRSGVRTGCFILKLDAVSVSDFLVDSVALCKWFPLKID